MSIDLNADKTACAAWVGRFLKARGVDRIFGLQGGHIQPIWDHVAREGIRIIDVRDEGAAVHMAHAHAELAGTFGVAMVTAGPGVTNTVTAMANASLARAPVLLIGGCRPTWDRCRTFPTSIFCARSRGHRGPPASPSRWSVSSTKRSPAPWATWANPGRSTSRFRPTCCAQRFPGSSCWTNGWRQSRRAWCGRTPPRSHSPSTSCGRRDAPW